MSKILGNIKGIMKIVIFNTYLFFCALYVRIFGIKYILFLAPFHENIGDHAIAISEKQFLKNRGIKPFEIHTKAFGYSNGSFAKLIPSSTTILVHGGGFMGTLWKHEEIRLRKVFEFFPNHKIVVFPQTVTFADKTAEDREFFEESKKYYSMGSNTTVFVREEKSFNFMKEKMPEINVKLVPDIVTRYKVEDKKMNRNGIIFCFRRDNEKSLSDSMKNEILSTVKAKYGSEKITSTDTVIDHMVSKYTREKEVDMKLDQFRSSKLVITDRLHGMVLAAITNTPVIAFSNSNGKVKGVYNWIKGNEFVKYADSVEQFKEDIESLDLDKEYKYYIDETLFDELSKAVER